jgi:hypothetical protein
MKAAICQEALGKARSGGGALSGERLVRPGLGSGENILEL